MRNEIAIAGMLAWSLGACGMNGDMSTNEASGALTDHGEAVSKMRTAAAQHTDRLLQAQTLAEMRDGEIEYRAAIGAGMQMASDAIERGNASGGMCSGGMSGARMMRDLTRELDDHQARMDAAQTMEEARAEEERHRAWMNEELGHMDGDHEMMRGMCRGC